MEKAAKPLAEFFDLTVENTQITIDCQLRYKLLSSDFKLVLRRETILGEEWVEIRHLWVRPRLRHQGIGNYLMQQSLNLAHRRNWHVMLTAIPFDYGTEEWLTATKRLHDWYATYGFVFSRKGVYEMHYRMEATVEKT